MPSIDEIPGEKPTLAPELNHEPLALPDRLEQGQYSRRTLVRVEPVAEMVDPRQVSPVVVRDILTHRIAASHALTRATLNCFPTDFFRAWLPALSIRPPYAPSAYIWSEA